MKATLKLKFSNDRPAVLEETSFCSGLDEGKKVAIRGKTAIVSAGAFSWSPAVRGMVTLVLRTVLARASTPDGVAIASIKGAGGSPAASFDYALSKQPCWLQDMFGVEASGRALSSRLFLRRNPNRKRGGDVEIWINQALLQSDSIEIEWMGERIEKSDEVRLLIRNLGLDDISGHQRMANPPPKSKGIEAVLSQRQSEAVHRRKATKVTPFFRAFEQSAINSLKYADIFSPRVTNNLLKEAFESERFNGVARRNWRDDFLFDPQKVSIYALEQFTGPSTGLRDRALSFGFFPGDRLAMLVSERLRVNYALQLDMRFSFGKAGSVVEQMAEGGLDLALVPLALCHTILGKRGGEYKAIGILPSEGAKIFRPPHAKGLLKQEEVVFEYPCREFSSGHGALDRFFQRTGKESKNARRRDTNLIDQLARINSCEENVRFIAWFPFSFWAENSYGATISPGADNFPTFGVLFIRRSIPASIRMELLGCIYSSLAELAHIKSIRDETISRIAGNVTYLRTLAQLGGAHAVL